MHFRNDSLNEKVASTLYYFREHGKIKTFFEIATSSISALKRNGYFQYYRVFKSHNEVNNWELKG